MKTTKTTTTKTTKTFAKGQIVKILTGVYEGEKAEVVCNGLGSVLEVRVLRSFQVVKVLRYDVA